MIHKERAFISYDGKCPFRCKHCYTVSLDSNPNRTVDEILNDIKFEKFDIIYVSQKNENFVNPSDGLLLCEKAFDYYNTNLVIITRNVFDEECLNRLFNLHTKMNLKGRKIIVGVSFVSLNNSEISERLDIIPSPQSRISFLKKLHSLDIPCFALIRPVFPKELIPLDDIENLIDECKKFVNCIVASELAVNSIIEKNLGICFNSYCCFKSSEYLNGAINTDLKFLQLDEEMRFIAQKCKSDNIHFFTHSMQAINYICGEEF